MIIFSLLFSALAFSQTVSMPLTNEAQLRKEAMARTVFIRMYDSADTSAPIKATGVILKDGYILTNEHVLRPHLSGKKVAFHIYTSGKRNLHKFEDMSVLGCDNTNDICLMKSGVQYNDSYFTMESPSFRKITDDKPIGLFKEEMIYFNGFCEEYPTMKKGKYIDYTSSAYRSKIAGLENRHFDTPAIQFSAEDGRGIACGGDSGGPLFDANLYFYGIVRDSISTDNKSKNFAVPVSILKDFIAQTKDKNPVSKLLTITDFAELDTIFPKAKK
jgi:hypothetical protein